MQGNFTEALKIAEKLGDSIRLGTIMLNISNVYSEQPATLEKARDYYLQAMEIGESIGYRDLLGLGSINLGEVYFKLENYDSALFYFEKSLLDIDSKIDMAATLGNIERTYAEKGDYRNAFNKYLSLQNEIDNTIYKIETEDKTNQLMFSFQLEKKEDAIQILEREAEIEQLTTRRQRGVIIFTGSLGLLILMFAGGLYNRFQFIR